MSDDITLMTISQATPAQFTDLFVRLTFLCFVQAGAKRVQCPVNGEMIAEEGDLLIFPPASMVTLENRPLQRHSYRAAGAYLGAKMVARVFQDQRPHPAPGIQIVRAQPHQPATMLTLLQTTLADPDLPEPIRQHRLLEPLIWLRHLGVRLVTDDEQHPISQVRALIEADPAHPWRAADVARHFAMSEATFRRWLAPSGQGFARILHNTRLEIGLAHLQGTDLPISTIALDCGFKTPSHFSDAFKQRFGIQPRAIRMVED